MISIFFKKFKQRFSAFLFPFRSFSIFQLFLIMQLLENIVSSPVIRRSKERNMPAWLLLPLAGRSCIFFFWKLFQYVCFLTIFFFQSSYQYELEQGSAWAGWTLLFSQQSSMFIYKQNNVKWIGVMYIAVSGAFSLAALFAEIAEHSWLFKEEFSLDRLSILDCWRITISESDDKCCLSCMISSSSINQPCLFLLRDYDRS